MTSVSKILDNLDYGPAPESDSIAQQWLDSHNRLFGLFIGGEFTPATSSTFPTVNPANGKELASISEATVSDVNSAVAAAKSAQKEWAALSGHQRSRFLYAIARGIQKHSRLFAVLETLDNGKPIRESRDIDIPLVARHFYHHAGWAQLRDEEFPNYEPVGVVGQVIPWNFPLLMLAWKIAPALAMGNTVVLKPAEFTSLTALLFAEICQQAGLPKGVVNIVTGAAETGKAIVEHPDLGKIAFTGSTEVGRILRRATAGTGKKLTLELGGKSPFIVFDDADLDAAVEGVVDAIWFNQGQVCCAGSRLLVQENVAEKFYAKLKRRMENLRVGNPLNKAIDVGAIVDASQLKQISSLVEAGKQEGVCHQASCPLPTDGYYFPPTLFTDVSPSAKIAQEEIFGPVLVAMTFRTPAEAVDLANNTRYGLAASIWSENVNLTLDVAPKVKAGVVWINCTNVFDAAAGFGGYRESGFGREGGKEGLYEYLKESLNLSPTAEYTPPTPSSDLSFDPLASIDRTAKMYIGGKQKRPDGGYSYSITDPKGSRVGEASLGNRKDIRDAVEAATKSKKWGKATSHNRAQVLYFLAENLSVRKDEFIARLTTMTGSASQAIEEVELSITRLFYYAARADKYDGNVHHTPFRNVTIAMPEAVGVLGIVCPEKWPLLGFISNLAPALALGNRVVIVPSTRWPLAATDFYQIIETSDVPAGTVNIITGDKETLTATLANHDAVDGLWYHGSKEGSRIVEHAAAENMKRTWVNYGLERNFETATQGQGDVFMRRASEIKNIWVPYGEMSEISGSY